MWRSKRAIPNTHGRLYEILQVDNTAALSRGFDGVTGPGMPVTTKAQRGVERVLSTKSRKKRGMLIILGVLTVGVF
jgi:hypothetical protein